MPRGKKFTAEQIIGKLREAAAGGTAKALPGLWWQLATIVRRDADSEALGGALIGALPTREASLPRGYASA